MGTVSRRSTTTLRTLGPVLMALFLAACGGSSADLPPVDDPGPIPAPTPPDLTPGGIWQGTYTTGDDTYTILGLVTETNRFHFLREEDGAQFFGTLAVEENQASGPFTAALELGAELPDASTGGSGMLDLTIVERDTLSGSWEFTSSGGSSESGTINLVYNDLYAEPSSLAIIAGTYTDALSGSDSLTISADGTVFAQNGATNCVANGQVSIVNPVYNAYAVSVEYSSCSGDRAVLNGVTFSGLFAINDTVAPAELVGGLTGLVNDQHIAISVLYNRT